MAKRIKKTLEEQLLEREMKDRLRAEKLAIKAIKVKPVKVELSEEQLVKKYAKRVIMNQSYHGRIDKERFQGINDAKSVNKNLWLDNDFFFSVVFQSQAQKVQFMQKSGLIKFCEENTENYAGGLQIQIVNGLEYAKHLGIELKKEIVTDYPIGDLELLPFILDNEGIVTE